MEDNRYGFYREAEVTNGNQHVQLYGSDISGNTIPINLTTNGELNVSNPYFEISKNNVSGTTEWIGVGQNPDLDVATSPEDVWSLGDIYDFEPTTAVTLTVISDNANDILGGTGANIILLIGLDNDGLEQQELINMNGLTGVTSTLQYKALNRVLVIFGGSSGQNEGNISINGDGTIAGYIDIGINATQNSVYTVPSNKTAHMTYLNLNVGKNKDASFFLLFKSPPSNVFIKVGPFGVYQSNLYVQPPIPFRIEPNSVIKIQATTENNNTNLSVSYGLAIVTI